MEALHRTTRLMGWAGLCFVPAAAWVGGWRAAVGLASGMLWALTNAWALSWLVHGSLGAQRVSRGRWLLLWVVKLPLLYGVGAILLVSPWSSPVGFLAGFSSWSLLLVVGALREASA